MKILLKNVRIGQICFTTILVILVIVGLSPVSLGRMETHAESSIVTITSETGEVILKDGDVLKGVAGGNTHVTIAAGATVTLSGVTINPETLNDSHSYGKEGCKWSGITCSGDATIILAEGTTNTVKGFCRHYPGIYIPEGYTLTIKGSGSLEACSGTNISNNEEIGLAAGIGAANKLSCGDINIEDGNITAVGGSDTGSGIGGCWKNNCGNITISGGNVTASSLGDSPGIGSGENASCGDITITGGIVYAKGGYLNPGIGAACQWVDTSYCGNITISGGNVTAIGDWGAGIGSGYHGSVCGDIFILGGTVTAIGDYFGAGIGSGGYDKSSVCGNIVIVGGTINATAGSISTNSIGAGKNGRCGSVNIGGVEGAISESPYSIKIEGSLYTVSFDSNGGSGTMSDQSFYRGMETSLTENCFTRDGYAFWGWGTEPDGEVVYRNRQKVKNLTKEDNITLYAIWYSTEGVPDGLQIDGDYKPMDDGFYYVNMPKRTSEDDIIAISISDVNTRFKIYDDGGKSENYSNSSGTSTIKVTVPEGYKIIINGAATYSGDLLFYDYYEGNGLDYKEYICGGQREYHKGSFSTISTTGRYMTIYFYNDSSYEPKEGLNFTAAIEPVNYSVSFNVNTSEVVSGLMENQTFTYGEGSKALTKNSYICPGYEFVGWATSADGEVVYSDAEEVSDLSTIDGTNIELFAKWKKSLTANGIVVEGTDDKTYTGSPIESIVVKDGENDITDECNITYINNLNVGTANVSISAKNDSEYIGSIDQISFEIVKATPNVIPPKPLNKVYNGSLQPIIEGGSTDFGELKYIVGGVVFYDIPIIDIVGQYTVEYIVEGNDNWYEVKGSVISSIYYCKHPNKKYKEAKSATCTEAGNSAYYYCKDCDKYFLDADCSNEIEKESCIIPAYNHNFGEPEYIWSEDGKSCIATVICTNDTSHKITEVATITSEVKTPATTSSKGTTTYKAIFKNELFDSQTKNVDDIKENVEIPKNKLVNTDKGSQYYKADGKLAKNEWVTINNVKYFFNFDGYNASNEWVDGKWISEDGSCTYEGELTWKNNNTGWWVEDSKGWYPVSSWQKIDGIWYYFTESGYMAYGEYYNGYWFNEGGSWDEQYFLTWKSNSTGWWVEDISGWWPSSQWLKIDGSWYYFDGSGYMVTSQYVDGYWIGADGVCQ